MHSVLSCLQKCTDDWYLYIDNGNFTSFTFIDRQKPFDTVKHDILLQKIYLFDIKIRSCAGDMETARMVYRSINNEAPNYLTGLLERLSQSTARELRNIKIDFALSLKKTSGGQRCFSYRGARLWKNLTADAKNAQTLTQFKLHTKIPIDLFVNKIIFNFLFLLLLLYVISSVMHISL